MGRMNPKSTTLRGGGDTIRRVFRKLQLLGQVLPLKLGDIYMSAFMLDFVSVHLS